MIKIKPRSLVLPVFGALVFFAGYAFDAFSADAATFPPTTTPSEDKSLPSLPGRVKVERDLSKENSVITQEFLVKQYWSYPMYLTFSSFSHDLKEIEKFTGDGTVCFHDLMHDKCVSNEEYWKADPDGNNGAYEIKHVHPGTMIPVHIKIEKIDNQKNIITVLDKSINTVGMSGAYSGGYLREIGFAKLRRGKYRLTATTLQKNNIDPIIIDSFIEITSPDDALPFRDDE
jgi:hypothetical protein